MDLAQQKRLGSDYGFNLAAEYRGNNKARVIPHTIWKRDFDGALLVSYRATYDGSARWKEGDTSLATMHHWLFSKA